MALATSCLIPLFNLSLLVTNKSSPTIWVFLLLAFKNFINPSHDPQSSSEKGSSIDFIGYLSIKSK